MIHHGDCLEVMAAMESESVDAIVTDPPYGIRFMGKAWDGADIQRRYEMQEAARAARGDTKRSSSAFTNGAAAAGEYDRSLPAQRAFQEWCEEWGRLAYRVAKPSAYLLAFGGTRTVHRMTVALEDAGWIIRDMLVWAYASGFPKSKASLKPAWEPIVMARKPGPLRELAIDACRIPGEPWQAHDASGLASVKFFTDGDAPVVHKEPHDGGRWPANVILTDPIFDGGVEGVVGGGETRARGNVTEKVLPGDSSWFTSETWESGWGGDSGTYSRFFLIPKADRADREPVLGGLQTTKRAILGQGIGGADNLGVQRANTHPTVKPTELMRHLVRLVTPSGGLVLDPFLGSGTTGLACELEGFPWVGIEREAEYVAIAEARLNGTQRGLGLDVGAPTKRRVLPSDAELAKKAQTYPASWEFYQADPSGWHEGCLVYPDPTEERTDSEEAV